MARSLDRRATKASKEKEKKRKERFDQLETEIVGLTQEILDTTFPEQDDGSPDWDKFKWDRAEAFKQLLEQFHDSRGTRPTDRKAETKGAENGKAEKDRNKSNAKDDVETKTDKPKGIGQRLRARLDN